MKLKFCLATHPISQWQLGCPSQGSSTWSLSLQELREGLHKHARHHRQCSGYQKVFISFILPRRQGGFSLQCVIDHCKQLTRISVRACVCVKLIWASSLILFLNNNVLIWESRTHGFQVFKMGMSCYSFPVPTHNGTDIWGSFMFCSHPTGNTVSPSHLQRCIFYPSATLYLLATHDTVSPSHLQHCIFCPSATLTLLHCIFCSPHSQGCFPEKQSVQYVFYHCPMANRHLAHY